MAQCKATTTSGNRCKNRAGEFGFCRVHDQGHITQAEFARRSGFSESYVHKMRQEGIITLTDAGLIDPVAAALEARRDHARPARRAGVAGRDVNASEDPDGSLSEQLLEERVNHEREKARLAKMKADEMQGILLDANSVRSDFYTIASVVRQTLRNIPARLCNEVFACDSPREVRELLSREIDQVLNSMADAAGSMEFMGEV